MNDQGGRSPERQAASLVADIGGTRARFALVDATGRVGREAVFELADFAGPLAAIKTYLQSCGQPAIDRAVLALAAPVGDGERVRLTNAVWIFDRTELMAGLGLRELLLINDFTALALSLPVLPPTALRQVGGGSPDPAAPHALIGPGTGLGVSGLIPANGDWLPLAGEGGHVTLAASDGREAEIIALARREFPSANAHPYPALGSAPSSPAPAAPDLPRVSAAAPHAPPASAHVSAERLVSGSGLPLLHRLVNQVDRRAVVPLDAPAIVAGALAGDAACRATIDTFCAFLGSVAGNLVLTLGARGGLYLGGGILPRLGRLLDDSPFRQRFEAKGRFAELLANIPAYVILAPAPALQGAAQLLYRTRHPGDKTGQTITETTPCPNHSTPPS